MTDKTSATATKYVVEDGFKKFLAEKGFSHYLALQMKTLMPYGELSTKLSDVQNAVISDLGTGILGKPSDVGDLSVRLIGITQSMNMAIEMSLRSVKPLDLIEDPAVDFGMVLGAHDGANITLFSKVLDDLVEHLVQHFNKSAGVKAERLTYTGSSAQPGLFKMQLAARVGSDSEVTSKAKFGKKGRIGKFEFHTLHVVDVSDHKEFAQININLK